MPEYPYLSSEKDFLPNGKQTSKEENVRMKAKVAIHKYIIFVKVKCYTLINNLSKI